MSGLLVITAHPDDEVLIAGGTLAACAAAGMRTAVVCLTRGEEGPISDPSLATRATLAEVRRSELHDACRELGVDSVKCYRRHDGHLRWSRGSEIVRQLEGVLQAHRPDAVITFGEEGLYYHPDHIAVYDFTRRAVARLPDPPELYRSIWPAELMCELTDELARRGLPADLWGLEPDIFGVEDEDREGELLLDVTRFARRKLRALRCHRTQLGADHAFTNLPEDLVERFFGIERFAPLDPLSGDTPEAPAESSWLDLAVGARATHA